MELGPGRLERTLARGQPFQLLFQACLRLSSSIARAERVRKLGHASGFVPQAIGQRVGLSDELLQLRNHGGLEQLARARRGRDVFERGIAIHPQRRELRFARDLRTALDPRELLLGLQQAPAQLALFVGETRAGRAQLGALAHETFDRLHAG